MMSNENQPQARQEGGAHHQFLPRSPARRAYLQVVHGGFRIALALYVFLLRLTQWIRPAQRAGRESGYEVLLTGTFYSDNWVSAHLRPLAMAGRCARVRMVSTTPVPVLDKVEGVYPPAWLIRAVGGVPARLMTFVWVAFRTRPHLVGGFHLLINGLVVALLARLIGARALYFCVGGAAEVLEGGVRTESRLFDKLQVPNLVIERRLFQVVAACDHIITMGKSSERFFRQRGIERPFHVISGGIDTRRFYPSVVPPIVDVIFVGRLVPIKCIDLFLRAIQIVQRQIPTVAVTIVGDGPLRGALEGLSRELGIARNVTFAGQQHEVETWLRRAKLFILTSESEGLSLSLMEAMTSGLPAVVPDVGDLSDLVEHGVNGFLIRERTPEAFAAPLLELLTDAERLACFRAAARQSAKRCELGVVSHLWDDILTESVPGEQVQRAA